MSYWKPNNWWDLVGGVCALIAVVSILGLLVYGTVWASLHPAPPKTAKDVFVEQCGGYNYGVDHIGNTGIAIVQSDNPNKWKCIKL